MQTSLPHDLVQFGASTLLSVISTSCAIFFMAIGQTIFQKQLPVNMRSVLSTETVQKILKSGVTDLASMADRVSLPVVVQKYSLSVTRVFASTIPYACLLIFVYSYAAEILIGALNSISLHCLQLFHSSCY